MNFSDALNEIKAGKKLARSGWNGKNMWVELQLPSALSTLTLAYISMQTATGDLMPWLASQTDILADDWEVVGI